MTRLPPLHPFFLGGAVVCSAYAWFLNETLFPEVLLASVVVLAFLGAVWSAAWLYFRDARRASVLCSVFLVLSLSYPALHRGLVGWTCLRPSAGHVTLVSATLLLLGILGWRIRRSRHSWQDVTVVLNVTLFFALLLPVAQLAAASVLRAGKVGNARRLLYSIPLPRGGLQPQARPDIYYIVLDRYANETVLREQLGYDNRPFLAALRELGFHVTREAYSNYLKTPHSLASSLNMTYLDRLAETVGRDTRDWHPLFVWLEDHAVGRFLKREGYQYVHMGSWWWPTRSNSLADSNYHFTWVPDTVYGLAKHSLLGPLADGLELETLDFRWHQWERVQAKFEQLRQLTRVPGPKFVFAHMLVPHDPYVFDSDGTFLPEELLLRRSEEENYRNQLTATNRLVEGLVRHLLANSPAPPVIILQGDEGPYPTDYRKNVSGFQWRDADRLELQMKAGILHAVYLPGSQSETPLTTRTPVNTFRIVFNHYFRTELPLLPEKIYAHESDLYPYRFYEMTERVVFSSEDAETEAPGDQSSGGIQVR